jgi:hypothetical protein
MLILQGQIADRAYFGDHWDYTVRLSDRTQLVVSIEPRRVCSVGDTVILEIDPDDLSVIIDDGGTSTSGS